jgi:hypothetical protein
VPAGGCGRVATIYRRHQSVLRTLRRWCAQVVRPQAKSSANAARTGSGMTAIWA